jgi:hypothetical protein
VCRNVVVLPSVAGDNAMIDGGRPAIHCEVLQVVGQVADNGRGFKGPVAEQSVVLKPRIVVDVNRIRRSIHVHVPALLQGAREECLLPRQAVAPKQKVGIKWVGPWCSAAQVLVYFGCVETQHVLHKAGQVVGAAKAGQLFFFLWTHKPSIFQTILVETIS